MDRRAAGKARKGKGEGARARSFDEWLADAGARSPLLTGMLTLVVGFGVICTMYLVAGRYQYPQLRGLFSFGSATIGDAVLLPIAAALAAAFLRETRNVASEKGFPDVWRAGRLRNAGLACGLLATGGLYVSWLVPADTQLNWTQPLPHTMNLFGLWHLAFFAVMFVWFSVFYVRVLVLLSDLWKRRADGVVPSWRVAKAWALFNAVLVLQLLFGALLVNDYRAQILSTTSGWTWLLAPVLGLAIYIPVTVSMWRLFVPRTDPEYKAMDADQAADERHWVAVVVGTICVAVAVFAVALAASQHYTSSTTMLWTLAFPATLAVVAAWNSLQAMYTVQRREVTPLGWVTILSAGTVLAAGFVGGLASALTMLPSRLTMISALGPAALRVVVTSALATVLAAMLCLITLSLEQRMPARRGTHGILTRLSDPSGEIIQNFAQFAMMQSLLVMPCALLDARLLALLKTTALADPMQLFYGYAALAGVAITFPLTNNMAYVRDIKNAARGDVAPGHPESVETALIRSNYYTNVTLLVGGLTVAALAWVWIKMLMSIIG